MADVICPNYNDCRLINKIDFSVNPDLKYTYLRNYCKSEKDGWTRCTRFLTKSELGLCPDFVMPDTAMSFDEILNEFEKEINNKSNN